MTMTYCRINSKKFDKVLNIIGTGLIELYWTKQLLLKVTIEQKTHNKS